MKPEVKVTVTWKQLGTRQGPICIYVPNMDLLQGWAVETTPGFNRLKPSRSICQKVVNTGQYESERSIETFNWPFWWWIEILRQGLGCIYRKKKKKLFLPCQGHFFTIALTSALQLGVQAPNTSLF